MLILSIRPKKASFNKPEIIITSQADTWQSASQKSKVIIRYVYTGNFSFAGNTIGSLKLANINQITSAVYSYGCNPLTSVIQYSDESIASFRFSNPYTNFSTAIPVSAPGYLVYSYSTNGGQLASSLLGGSQFSTVPVGTDRAIVQLDPGYSELLANWWDNPFSSSANVDTYTGSSGILSTKTGIDILAGTNKQKDIFSFGVTPEYTLNIDKTTNFSTKDKDVLQFSKSAFGVSVGRLAIAKTQNKLNKMLASDVDVVYNKKSGQLILNANGAEPGFGDDGGVFALLAGSPVLNNSSVSFI